VVKEASSHRSPAVGSPSSGNVWLVEHGGDRLKLIEFNGELKPTRTLVTGPFPPGDTSNNWRAEYLNAVDWQGERWLPFEDHSAALHIVKVAGDCTYRSAYRPPAR
jgi:hypothetical protein